MSRALIAGFTASLWLACTPAKPPIAPQAEGAVPFAAAPGPSRPSSLRFSLRSATFCVATPDGRFFVVTSRIVDGRRAMVPVQVPVALDLVCRDSQQLALHVRGAVSELNENPVDPSRPMRPRAVYPDAVALSHDPFDDCYLTSTGEARCQRNGEDMPYPYLGRLALGPIAAFAGAECVRSVDGAFACSGEVLWPDVRAGAAVDSMACAVQQDGSVFCRGPNDVRQRGVRGQFAPAQPTLVPGLADVQEVAVSGEHACARRGGEVFCWGRSDAGQLGPSPADQVAWPRCKVDRARTEAAAREIEAGKKICSGPRPPGDDPFCRGMHGAYASDIYVTPPPGESCDPAGVVRHAGVSKLPVDDALAVGLSRTSTCVLRQRGTITCWGGGSSESQSVALPASAPVAVTVTTDVPRVALPPVRLELSWAGALVDRGAGNVTLHRWHGSPLEPAIALTAHSASFDDNDYALSLLEASGRLVFEKRLDGYVRPPSQIAGIATLRGDCGLTADGAVVCPREPERAASLTAGGRVIDLSGRCALYDDGHVACTPTSHAAINQFPDAIAISTRGWTGLGCVLTRAGEVKCTGRNDELGRGVPGGKSAVDPATLTAVPGLPPMKAIASSGMHVCAIERSDEGGVWCWGNATAREAGPTGYAQGLQATACPIDRAATAEQARLLRAQRPECRGRLTPGDCRPTQFTYVEGCETPGDFGLRRSTLPVQVPGVSHAVAIAAYPERTCALTADDELVCWGSGARTLLRQPSPAR